LISSGALYRVYDTSNAERTRLQSALATATEEVATRERSLADADAEVKRLAGLADQASSQRQETAERLIANEETVQRLEVERAALEGRYAALQDDNERLGAMLQGQRTEITASEAARDRISLDLADARQALAAADSRAEDVRETLSAEVEGLTAELDRRAREVASLADELKAGMERSKAANASLAEIRKDRADLERRLAAADADKWQVQADRQVAEEAATQAERRLASLEAEMRDAESRLATVVAGLTAAEAGRREAVQQVFGLEAELTASRSWLGQIAQYHRVYASTARRHLVEVGADELEHIQDWLGKMLGRPIPVPDLTDYGVTFAGARLLGISDKPVAQLVYLDADDQPLALCIIPSTGGVKNPTQSTNGELNLVDWRDGRHGYAVVGWSDPELLSSLTEAVRPVYEL
jgi:anti-sigma factor RsiW